MNEFVNKPLTEGTKPSEEDLIAEAQAWGFDDWETYQEYRDRMEKAVEAVAKL